MSKIYKWPFGIGISVFFITFFFYVYKLNTVSIDQITYLTRHSLPDISDIVFISLSFSTISAIITYLTMAIITKQSNDIQNIDWYHMYGKYFGVITAVLMYVILITFNSNQNIDPYFTSIPAIFIGLLVHWLIIIFQRRFTDPHRDTANQVARIIFLLTILFTIYVIITSLADPDPWESLNLFITPFIVFVGYGLSILIYLVIWGLLSLSRTRNWSRSDASRK